MSARVVRRRRLAILLSGALVAGTWAGPVARALGSDPAPRAASSTSHVVRGGDTLWSIAEAASPGEDPRALVDAISEANGVDAGSIVPGQVLLIPASG